MKNPSVYEIATQKILSLLEQGVAPWRKAWTDKMYLPAMNYALPRFQSALPELLL